METIRDTGYRDDLARLTPNLRRFARALVRNHHTDAADELVQATLVRALTADQGRRGQRLFIWLISILTGLHRDQVHHASSEQKVRSGGSDGQGWQPGGHAWNALQSAQRRDPTLLSSIPLEYREVLLLVVVENMSYAQVAESLGLSVNTVATRIARARDYLSRAQQGWSDEAAQTNGQVRSTARATAPYLRVVK